MPLTCWKCSLSFMLVPFSSGFPASPPTSQSRILPLYRRSQAHGSTASPINADADFPARPHPNPDWRDYIANGFARRRVVDKAATGRVDHRKSCIRGIYLEAAILHTELWDMKLRMGIKTHSEYDISRPVSYLKHSSLGPHVEPLHANSPLVVLYTKHGTSAGIGEDSF
jgi:hypothetical protein